MKTESFLLHQDKNILHKALSELKKIEICPVFGIVYGVKGGIILGTGLRGLVSLGGVCMVETDDNTFAYGEVIGFEGDITKILIGGAVSHIRSGVKIYPKSEAYITPSSDWLGHIVDAFGRIRYKGELHSLPEGTPVSLHNSPPPAALRRSFGERLESNTALFNTFLPLCKGQRVGLFAGSGVGKSTLMSHFAKNIEADIVVIGLIGERGREVNEFAHKTLSEEMRKKCVIIAVSSDESALIKRRGAYTTLAVAEYFRDQGKNVLLLLDSLTRLAEAQREIGLMAGEPPAMRAFPPSAFAEIMGLCERAGPGIKDSAMGDITAIFTVLVQGGDMEEPIADCVRGTLDGHFILEREIAERGLYPAVNILKSISRSLPDCATSEENKTLIETRRMLAEYKDIEPMVRLGVYKTGTSPATDRAVSLYPALEKFIYSTHKMKTKDAFKELKNLYVK